LPDKLHYYGGEAKNDETIPQLFSSDLPIARVATFVNRTDSDGGAMLKAAERRYGLIAGRRAGR
jgi:hypothetical protein